VVQLIVLLTKY